MRRQKKYDKKYQHSGVIKNLDNWSNNKGWLTELLRRHSRWDEDAMAVIFDVTLNREVDPSAVGIYKNDLFCLLEDMELGEEDQKKFHTSIDIAVSGYAKILNNNDTVSYIKEYTGIPCATGQKTSRVINRICQKYRLDKHPGYNARFARLADSLNPLKIKRQALLSVHPCDYLEMSNRVNSWNSCHCLDDGEYHAGTLSYMNDECSMIFYTVDNDVEEDYFKAPKRSRQVFCFNSGILLQSRLYPNTDDEDSRNTYRNIVQQTIADCLAVPNLWKLSSEVGNRVQTHDDAMHYPDYNYPCYKARVSILKDAEVGEDKYIIAGHTAYCLECSQPISETKSLYCDLCGDNSMVCCGCGNRVHEDDVNYLNGSYYCEDCCNYCEHCQEYSLEETTSVHSQHGYEISVCDHCRDDYYAYC